jgi:hypothetical protein
MRIRGALSQSDCVLHPAGKEKNWANESNRDMRSLKWQLY